MPSVEMLARIKELELENERLKAELKQTEAQDRFVVKELGENERLKLSFERTLDFYKGLCDRLHKENAKLKCLALHTMSEYCFAQGTIIHTKLEFTEQSIDEDRKMIHKVNIRDRWGEYFAEAYRKVKKELMGGK